MEQVEEINEQARPAGKSPADQEESLGELLAYYWNLLRRYYWVLLAACILTVGLGYFYTQQQPKIYQATSSVIFHKTSGSVLGDRGSQLRMMEPGGRWGFEQFWNTQKQVFKSRWFAERVVEQAGLVTTPGFLSSPPKGETRTEDEKMEAAIAKVQAMTDINLKRESRVGIIDARAQNPEFAATVANTMAEEYVEYTKEFKSSGMKEITNWFDSYVAKKKTELEKAQSELQKFKQKNNILSFSYEDRQNLTANSMEMINNQLLQVKNQLSAKQALLEQLQKLENEKANTRAVANLVKNDTLDKLYTKESDLEQELARLETQYKAKHPKVESIQSALETVRDNIDSEIDRLQAGVRNEVGVLERNKKSLHDQLANLKQRIFRLNELGVEYRQKKSRVDNLNELYDTVLKRSAELNINSLSQPRDIRVLETAAEPETPVSPKLAVNLIIALFAGMALGSTGIVVLDTLDTTIKTKEDITRLSDKPVLAMLPELRDDVLDSVETFGDSPADTITHTAPKSSFAEGIKTLRTNLTFMAPDNPPRSLLVTSPGPGEGKTLTSINTGIAMAQSGSKTLLVDTDLRRPRIHTALGLDKEEGVTEALRSEQPVEQFIQESVVENMDILTSGEVPPNPSELLHSGKFENLVEELRTEYDRVLFDSPPLAVVSDALILSQLVDGVLLIVQFNKTRIETLGESLDQLHGVGAPLLGTVMNEISSAGDAYYGYRYSYYRYGGYGYEDDQESDAPADNNRLAS